MDKDRKDLNEGDAPNRQVPDLDGDGMIGNTGGFYGGTSYLGSNFGPEWNSEPGADEGEGNYGAAGAKGEDEGRG